MFALFFFQWFKNQRLHLFSALKTNTVGMAFDINTLNQLIANKLKLLKF
jgi:hypothetical protein